MFNSKMADVTPRKLTDVSRLHGLGWKYKVELKDGVRLAYNWFNENYK